MIAYRLGVRSRRLHLAADVTGVPVFADVLGPYAITTVCGRTSHEAIQVLKIAADARTCRRCFEPRATERLEREP